MAELFDVVHTYLNTSFKYLLRIYLHYKTNNINCSNTEVWVSKKSVNYFPKFSRSLSDNYNPPMCPAFTPHRTSHLLKKLVLKGLYFLFVSIILFYFCSILELVIIVITMYLGIPVFYFSLVNVFMLTYKF